jgi:hypothetical protein
LSFSADYEASQYAARQLTSEIQSGLATVWESLERVWVYELWRFLGYENWSDYCRSEFAMKLPIPKEKRHTVINALTVVGMSTREIAAAVDVSRETVRRTLKQADTFVSGPCLQCNQPPPVLVTEYSYEEADKLRQVAEILLTVNLPKNTDKARLATIKASVKRIESGVATLPTFRAPWDTDER